MHPKFFHFASNHFDWPITKELLNHWTVSKWKHGGTSFSPTFISCDIWTLANAMLLPQERGHLGFEDEFICFVKAYLFFFMWCSKSLLLNIERKLWQVFTCNKAIRWGHYYNFSLAFGCWLGWEPYFGITFTHGPYFKAFGEIS